jgi:hypothetical protein
MVKCVKKSESVTHIWVTGGSEESIIILIKLKKYCYFHYLCGPICPTATAEHFALLFRLQTC